MKKLLILVSLFSFAVGTLNAQSALDKFLNGKKKKEEPKKEEVKKVLTPAEIAAADSANPFLNSKEIAKDPKGISGIYYSKVPIQVYFKGSGKTWAKKFLITYTESEKRNDIFIYSQYGYETTDINKWVQKAYFWLTPYDMAIQKKTGFIATWEDDNVANNNHEFYTHSESQDLQGNSIFGKDYLRDWTGGIVEAEPGIFFIGSMGSEDTKPEKIEKNKKYNIVAVLYRADKVEAAVKYNTNDAVWDKLAEVMKKYKDGEKQKTTDAVDMPAPKAGFKDAPTTTALNKAAQAFLDKYQGSDKLDYAYVSSEWVNLYKTIGTEKQNTLVGRELKAVIVATKNNECRVDFVAVRQDNTFTTGTFTENYGTNPLYIPASSVVNTIDCAKARKYKK